MNYEIEKLHKLVKNYRKHDGLKISQARIRSWIAQFDESDQLFILQELCHVLPEVYLSKKNAKEFLSKIISHLVKAEQYSSADDLLKRSSFVSTQEDGKSQSALLKMIPKVLSNGYGFDFRNIGALGVKHYIYIDDVLCTGNTFSKNMITWVTDPDKDRESDLLEGKYKLHIFYYYMSLDHVDKKLYAISCKAKDGISALLKPLRILPETHSSLLKPLKSCLSGQIADYIDGVTAEVDEYTSGNGWKHSKPNFLRDESESDSDDIYSSKSARSRLEEVFTKKGIAILKSGNASKGNVRPLGYSLPSYKDVGFGAMVFSWRNVANNTPLVFWYKTSSFMPLFKNKR